MFPVPTAMPMQVSIMAHRDEKVMPGFFKGFLRMRKSRLMVLVNPKKALPVGGNGGIWEGSG